LQSIRSLGSSWRRSDRRIYSERVPSGIALDYGLMIRRKKSRLKILRRMRLDGGP